MVVGFQPRSRVRVRVGVRVRVRVRVSVRVVFFAVACKAGMLASGFGLTLS